DVLKLNLAPLGEQMDFAFGRVHYYFQYTIDGVLRTVAMVEILADPDNDLFSRSKGACMAGRLAGDEGFCVVEHRQIVSVISLQPTMTSWGPEWEGMHFVCEKMGLDVVRFDLDEPDDDDDPYDDEPEYVD
ncbi:hypothetical protein AURDEDRAFT_63350, partial [Auricularia subglabra TFB-10046 SS5]